MALDTFIAGRYSATWNTSDVGITADPGYELDMSAELEDVTGTDLYGDSVIDGIYRGGQCFCQWTSKAYKTGSLAALWPFGGTLAGNGALGVLFNPGANNTPGGILASDLAKAFVLTATAGTPASATPATLTATKALLAKNYSSRLLFNSRLREVPVRLRFYPYDAGSALIRFFSTT